MSLTRLEVLYGKLEGASDPFVIRGSFYGKNALAEVV